MKVFNDRGSKERLFEMFQRVNKITLNEDKIGGYMVNQSPVRRFYDWHENEINQKWDEFLSTKSFEERRELEACNDCFWEWVAETFSDEMERKGFKWFDESVVVDEVPKEADDESIMDDLPPEDKSQVEIDNPDLYPDGWKEMDGHFMGPKDNLEGGLADNKSDDNYDPEQIAKGVDVEFEHTDDAEVSKEIAKDHLEEIPDYYDRLEDMENDAENDLEKDIIFGENPNWYDTYKPINVGDEINEIDDFDRGVGDTDAGQDAWEEEESYRSGQMELEDVSNKMAELYNAGDIDGVKEYIKTLDTIPMYGSSRGGVKGLGHRDLERLGLVRVVFWDEEKYVENISDKNIAWGANSSDGHKFRGILKPGERLDG